MSEQTNNDSTTNAPTATPKPKRTKSTRVEHSAAIASYAKAKNIDTVRAGKLFRAKLRANTEAYRKNGGTAHVRGSAWGSHPRKALAAIFPDVKAFRG
jgi:hypothetical protein